MALTGSGRLSLDHSTRHVVDKPWMRVFAATSVVPAAFFVVSRRERALATAQEKDARVTDHPVAAPRA
ncbi:MAG: hypothetical protein HOQ18_14085 [Dermatophilaceae bacterium]|nr:hypothetical protein [Dermatophilaceae bacterium]NUR82353.1 hypothetical protein [Dermatophilaceae bacterium]